MSFETIFIVVFVLVLMYFVYTRVKEKKEETFEKRDN
jgi:preprotein translocase subunit YajC